MAAPDAPAVPGVPRRQDPVSEWLHGHGHPPARRAALDPGGRLHRPLLHRVRPRGEPCGPGRGLQAVARPPTRGPRAAFPWRRRWPCRWAAPAHAHTHTHTLTHARPRCLRGHRVVLWVLLPGFRMPPACLSVCLSVCLGGRGPGQPVGVGLLHRLGGPSSAWELAPPAPSQPAPLECPEPPICPNTPRPSGPVTKAWQGTKASRGRPVVASWVPTPSRRAVAGPVGWGWGLALAHPVWPGASQPRNKVVGASLGVGVFCAQCGGWFQTSRG